MVNSTIPPILTKQTFVSHHKPLNVKNTQHITLEIKFLPGDRSKKEMKKWFNKRIKFVSMFISIFPFKIQLSRGEG
jgi:hypothetical protein